MKDDIIKNLHTTRLGEERIKRNLMIDDNPVEWCREQIKIATEINRKGKNWYIKINGVTITVNAYSYTIITAHRTNETKRKIKNLTKIN